VYPDGFSFDGNLYGVSTDNGSIPVLDESDVELFTSSGYPDFDYSIGVSDFCGEFDVGG